MATENNKNKVWNTPSDIKRRRKKVTEVTKKNAMSNIVNQFIVAIKNKHL